MKCRLVLLLVLLLPGLCFSSLTYDVSQPSLESVYVNYQNPEKELTAGTGSSDSVVVGYALLETLDVTKTEQKSCFLTEESLARVLTNTSMSIILVRRSNIINSCIHFSEFVRQVQTTLPQIKSIVVNVDYEGDPGYFSYNFYSSPTEDTLDIELAVYEVSMESYRTLTRFGEKQINELVSREGPQNYPLVLVFITISESQNSWNLVYTKSQFVAYQYIYMTIWTLLLIYSVTRLGLLVGIPFTSMARKSKLETRMALVFMIVYCICRAAYYGKDPHNVGKSINLMTSVILYYIGYWSILSSFTILSLIYVQIVQSLSNCFLWKARYFLWISMMLLLPFAIIGSVVYYILGNSWVYLFLALYLTALILFECIIIMHYGRKVIGMIQLSNAVSNDRHSNAVKRRVTMLIIISSVFFFLSFLISIVHSLPASVIPRTASNKTAVEAVRDIFNVILAFSMISTIVGFSNQKQTTSSTSSVSSIKKTPVAKTHESQEKALDLLSIN